MVDLAAVTDRRRVEARLEALVREHRVTIALVFPLVGGVLLVASHEGLLPPPLSFNAALILLGTLVMRLPLLVGLAPTVDRRGGVALLALAGYTYAVEAVGIATGVPYGEFSYGIALGPMVGGVPAALPVFFFPLALNAYLLVLLLLPRAGRVARLLGALALVVVVDLILDPAAVALGFWSYAAGGAYYGVPATNYAGWVLSGAVAVGLVEAGFPVERLRARLETCEFMLDDLVSFTLLWGTVNAYFGQWVPAALTVALVAGLVRADRFDFAV
ncbi:MAG: bisanhydrobacterioruberin hydratase [Halobacteriaceae archaeon]